MKYSPKLVGLLQALGLVGYVLLLVTTVHFVSTWFPKDTDAFPTLGMITFLLTFMTSALICGSIALAYPISLYIKDRKREAAQIVLWNVIFLMVGLVFCIIGFFALR